MTKKDFEAIAAVVRDAGGYVSAMKESDKQSAEDMRNRIARDLARELRGQNGRFDTERFLRACNV